MDEKTELSMVWQAAADDLGILVTAPLLLHTATGEAVTFVALVHHFGAPTGTLAGTLARIERSMKARRAADIIREARSYRWVGLYDVSATEIAAIGWTGTEAPAYPRFPVTQGLSGAAVAAREPVVVQDVEHDERYLTAFGSTRAEAFFPVAVPEDGGIIGTIDVESDRVNPFGPDDEVFLRQCVHALTPLWTKDGRTIHEAV
jgi:L-methionine (R)-S-oxide reductase